MTGGEAIAQSLLAHGVDTVFAIPGVQTYHLFDAFARAGDRLKVFAHAERIQAPVVSFRGGRGVVSDEHHLGFSCASEFSRWQDTDVLIGIGSRLELQWFRWPDQPAGLKIINIDIDPTQTERINPDIAIVGDARQCAVALESVLSHAGVGHRSRKTELQSIK